MHMICYAIYWRFSMKLRTYLSDKRITDRKFAEMLGTTATYLNHVKNGIFKCGKRFAKDIENLTNGEVTVQEIFEEYEKRQNEKDTDAAAKKRLT
jgi:DNA-binding transcriptional regulator YdaS (Cro superfamily)